MNPRTRTLGWIVLLLVLGLAGCGSSGGEDSPGREDAAAAEDHAGHDHGSEAEDAHAGHDHGSGAVDAHAGHDHGSEPEDAHAGHDHDEHAGEAEEGWVALTPAQKRAAGITLVSAAARELSVEQALPGEIVVNADRLAHIVPRFPGIAREVRKNLGDPVRAGDVLAVIEANESLALYEVKALIGGTVIEKHITLGEFVSDEKDIYVVADLSSVWANVTVYARDLERIRVGQRVTIEAAGISERAEGRIDYIGPVIGEATRTSIARVVLPNPRRVWRPGLYVTAHVGTDLAPVPMAVPDQAVQTVRGQSVVFVEEGDGFRARPVETGRTDGGWTEILAGLVSGERVVAGNSFILKSELLKSEAGHGHAH